MKTPPNRLWPPLVTNALVPRHIRVRDLLLTFLAWFCLLFFMRFGVLLLWDFLCYPVFELTHHQSPNWSLLWERLSTFVLLVIAVVFWIIGWAVKRRPQLRRQFDPRIAPILSLQEHATSLGLDPAEVERWRQERIVTVEFKNHRITAAHPHRLEHPKSESSQLPSKA